MNPILIAKIGAGIAIFLAGWMVNGWRLDSQFSDYKMAAEMASKAAIEQARDTEQTWNDKLNKERDNAAKREIQLRRDADSAHRASDGLRDQLSATARRIAQAPASACPDATLAIGELLNTCSQRYQELGEIADRHSSDVKTLIESWPN